MKFLILVSIIVLSLIGVVGVQESFASLSSPISGEMALSNIPKLGETAQLTITTNIVTRSYNYQNYTIGIILPPGFELVDTENFIFNEEHTEKFQNNKGRENDKIFAKEILVSDSVDIQTITSVVTIKAVQTGNWTLNAPPSSLNVIVGEDESFLVDRFVSITSNQDPLPEPSILIYQSNFEYEFQDDAVIINNNFTRLGILKTGTEYYVIQKAEFTASSFGDKDTRVDATIGFAIQPGDHILEPPMHKNATDTEHKEFSIKTQKQSKEFPQQSSIKNSFDFVVDIENPFYIQFPFVIDKPGQYTRQFYKTTHIFEGPGSSGMGGLVVVEKYSKAINENSVCKNDDYRRLIKHDYSTVVCVDSETAWKLIGRGWGL